MFEFPSMIRARTSRRLVEGRELICEGGKIDDKANVEIEDGRKGRSCYEREIYSPQAFLTVLKERGSQVC